MQATPENQLKTKIKQALSVTRKKASRWPGLRLFSNPRGTAWHTYDNFTRPVAYGLAPGSKTLASSDFIGWRTITITPEMVGHKIAQFVSIETKAPGGRATDAQLAWLDLVKQAGGVQMIASDLEDIDWIGCQSCQHLDI